LGGGVFVLNFPLVMEFFIVNDTHVMERSALNSVGPSHDVVDVAQVASPGKVFKLFRLIRENPICLSDSASEQVRFLFIAGSLIFRSLTSLKSSV